jgi:hypothetical protein
VTVGDIPVVQVAVHNVGDVWLTVTNIGQFGTGSIGSGVDPVTGMTTPSCMYPANSDLNYLYVGAFWIGAIVGRDTLVSVGVDDYYSVKEFWPGPLANVERRSIQTTSPFYHQEAKSEQDIIALYDDRLTDPEYVVIDTYDGRPHMPLNIEIEQKSYAWSYSYANDFILFDYSIKNVGFSELEQVYMGIYVDGDVHHESLFGQGGYGEDLCGFRRTFRSSFFNCTYIDTINIAYITDNDGDPDYQLNPPVYTQTSTLGAAGIRVVRTPSDSLKYSFNWWFTTYGDPNNDFGPRKYGTEEDPFRDMFGVLGTPLGDPNKYYVMRHTEFDYDQLFTAKDHSGDGWLPPPANALDFADGNDVRYLLSFGPFDISPGEVLPVSFAWVLGEGIHVNASDYQDFFDAYNPEDYYNTWDFSDLAANSRWASWIYDNPGVDTDNDGYRGKFRICVFDSILTDTIISEYPPISDTFWLYTLADTFYYEGDGVPDFKGASPPSPPQLWIIDDNRDTLRSRVTPIIDTLNWQGILRIRWNGLLSETEKDVFSNEIDFEGYRVYLSYSYNPKDFSLISSYDLEDYDKYVWNDHFGVFELKETPYTIDSLKTLYGEDFDPNLYDRDNLFFWEDSTFYFSPQDWNRSDLTDTMEIHKIYPSEPYPPTLNLDTARIHYPDALTPDGLFFKYFEYEYILRNLVPSRLYYVSVTAFDYGSPTSGLSALETQPLNNFVAEYAIQSASEIEENAIAEGLNVIVFPNPYRADGKYREYGFEGVDYIDYNLDLIKQAGLLDDRTRSLHFINLPHKCTIRIYTIDGDLIRKINHDVPANFPQASHERWDLVTRNMQAVVSGIYYYTIESEYGNQVGKFVVIM